MNESPQKLYKAKHLALICGAGALGFALAGMRLYAEHGRFTDTHLVAGALTLVGFVIMVAVIVRFANRPD